MRQAGANGWVERREPRKKVLISVRLRFDAVAAEASIHDISSSGVLVHTSTPPATGTFIELIGAGPPMVARVVWSNGARFGAELRDRLDVAALLTGRLDRRRAIDAFYEAEGRPDRRAKKKPADDFHRWAARWMEHAAVLAIGGIIALSMTEVAYAFLSDTSETVTATLRTSNSGSTSTAGESGRIP